MLALVRCSWSAAAAASRPPGPVTRVADDNGFGESTVRYAPALPVPGASPQEIVLGYLDAMLAFPVSTGTASAFLTPAAAKSWRPLDGVRVYSQPEGLGIRSPIGPQTSTMTRSRRPGRRTPDVVTGRATRPAGSLHPYERGLRSHVRDSSRSTGSGASRLRRPGCWSAASTSTTTSDRSTSTCSTSPGRRLIPVPVYLAVGDQLATSLVASLARGPADDLGDLTRTYVPKLDTLRPSVPVVRRRRRCRVRRGASARRASRRRTTCRRRSSGRLRQVPEIEGVRLTGGATVLTRNGLPVQPIDSWGAFGPSTAGAHAYATQRRQGRADRRRPHRAVDGRVGQGCARSRADCRERCRRGRRAWAAARGASHQPRRYGTLVRSPATSS